MSTWSAGVSPGSGPFRHPAPAGGCCGQGLRSHVQAAACAWRTARPVLAGLESRAERMAMVRFLVEEFGADVNGMDVREGQRLPNHWGTPAAYAVHANGEEGDRGREVVR